MASASTGWSCTHGAYILSETNTTATIRVTCYWQNIEWTYNINYVSAWVYCNGAEAQVMNSGSVNSKEGLNAYATLGYYDFVINKTHSSQSISCSAKITSNSSYVSGTKTSSTITLTVSAKPSYTISYNLNGGTGTFNNQVKWYDENAVLNANKPSRTGHSFVRWNTNTSNTGTGYAPGATYTANAALTLYAIWKADTYTVTYNANGGSGAPANQTKTYGVNLTLSSTKPTRTNYNFLGWATSASATTAAYVAGSTYSNNSAITLYAVWELAYVKPRITNFTANRCTSDGTISESGTYIKCTFNWATDKTVSSIYIDWTANSDWSSWSNAQITASGTSGSISQVIGGGNISTETTYYIRAAVYDSVDGTRSPAISVGTIKFPIDVKDKGTGVAIGKVAETDNLFDINWDTKVRGDLVVDGDAQAHARVVSRCGTTVAGTAGWYKVASQTLSGYGNVNILYYIKGGYSKGWYGLLDLEIRSSDTLVDCWKCEWIVRSGFSMNHVRIVISDMTWTLYVYNPSYQYGRVYFSEIQGRDLEGFSYNWRWPITYYNSTTPEAEEPIASVLTTDMNIKTKLMTIAPASRYSVTSTGWTTHQINCDYKLSDTSNGLLTMSNGGIKIGPNIKTVKISASLCFYEYPGNGEIDLKIFQNDTLVSNMYGNSISNAIFTATTNPIAISVTEGDMIYLKMVKGADDAATLLHNQGATSLTVEIVN